MADIFRNVITIDQMLGQLIEDAEKQIERLKTRIEAWSELRKPAEQSRRPYQRGHSTGLTESVLVQLRAAGSAGASAMEIRDKLESVLATSSTAGIVNALTILKRLERRNDARSEKRADGKRIFYAIEKTS